MFPIRAAQCEKSYAARLQCFRRPHAGWRPVSNGHLCCHCWVSYRELVYLLGPMHGVGHRRKGPGNSWSDFWIHPQVCTSLLPDFFSSSCSLVLCSCADPFSFIHFALLVIRSSIIKHDKPWKRPSCVKFNLFRFDIDVTITRRTRRHTCTCCAQLAANRHEGSASLAHPVLANPTEQRRDSLI